MVCRVGSNRPLELVLTSFRSSISYCCLSATQPVYNFPYLLVEYLLATIPSGDIRETVVNVMCDHALSDMEMEVANLIEESHCVYQATAYSGIPCEKVGSYQ